MKKALVVSLCLLFIQTISTIVVQVTAKDWQVGIGLEFSKPSEIATLIKDKDTVTIHEGIYDGDVASWYAHNILFRGQGRVQLKANGNAAEKKAIWVIKGNDCIVDGIEFYDCIVPDRNGAGIRGEGTNLTMRHCKFMNNQMGMLCGVNLLSTIIVEYCEFANSGYGDGLSHGIYIGHVGAFIYRFNYAHHTKIGHELKSRAAFNYIAYNRITNENGTASRNIDLPNGGTSFVIGNIIHKGANTENGNVIGYGLEGMVDSLDNSIYVNGNTIVSDRSIITLLRTHEITDTVKINNNIIAGTGTLMIGQSKFLDTNNGRHWITIKEAQFQNPTQYDYSLPQNSQFRNLYKLIDTVLALGSIKSMPLELNPQYEYRDTCKSVLRQSLQTLGALESVSPTGMSDFSLDLPLITPNPATDIITIQKASSCNSVQFYSLSGLSYSSSAFDGETINIGALPNGFYVVSICADKRFLLIAR